MEQRLKGISGNVILSDVRLDKEAKLIHNLGGKIIKINRNERLGVEKEIHKPEQGIHQI